MYIKFDSEKDPKRYQSFAYTNWAKTYSVDLSKPFLVIDSYVEEGKLIYLCVPPPSLRGKVEKVHLYSDCFSPVDLDLKLEEYL